MKKRAPLILMSLLLCTACFVHHPIRPDQLAALDGYTPEHQVMGPLEQSTSNGAFHLERHLLPPGTLRLVERSGDEWFDFTPDTVLHIVGTDRVFPWGSVQAAHFDGHTLRATLVDDGPIEVPIESVRSVEMNNFSAGRTVALGVGLGIGTLFGLLAYGLANFHCHC